jgi:hypothetical protein
MLTSLLRSFGSIGSVTRMGSSALPSKKPQLKGSRLFFHTFPTPLALLIFHYPTGK